LLFSTAIGTIGAKLISPPSGTGKDESFDDDELQRVLEFPLPLLLFADDKKRNRNRPSLLPRPPPLPPPDPLPCTGDACIEVETMPPPPPRPRNCPTLSNGVTDTDEVETVEAEKDEEVEDGMGESVGVMR